MNSDSFFYSNTSYISSDIPGDTTVSKYGYGSYTFNYKNKSCLFLSRIYLIEEDYDSAQKQLNLAKNTYKATYSCGSGYNYYNGKIDGLQTLCFFGKKEYDKLIKLNLPNYMNNSKVLIQALRSTYSHEQIVDSLNSAEASLKFAINNSYTTVSTYENYGEENEKEIEYQYLDGKATVLLFGEVVELKPWLNLKADEVATQKMYLNSFRNSSFYQDLLQKVTVD